jgi:cytochrome c oxidase subunit 3
MSDASVAFVEHAPHFNSAAHEKRAAQMGMWLFLVNEVLLFAGLFTAFFMYRFMYTDTFRYLAFVELDWVKGTINTAVLLASSFTVVLAVQAARARQSTMVGVWLLATIGFAFVFLVIKYFEYTHKIQEGLLPGPYFTYDLAESIAKVRGNPEQMSHITDANINLSNVGNGAPMFFTLYFFITGLHGIHVLIGMGLLGWMAVRAFRGEFARKNDTPIELSGMYWHLVDLIWIYVYPMLYLL